ncbi:MAG: FtsX-like permease family protein [Actinobacteria bacterium]|nr:MAG: FtsX-like permease family protein [Actinomycetota bacterium]
MLAVALKGLAARKFRASLIGLAIVLGVAMISGTYVLTDTINNGFNTIFKTSYRNADLIISGKAAFSNGGNGNTIQNPTFPDTVLPKVRALPDVGFAAGSVQSDTVKLVSPNGKLISAGNAPSLGFSLDPKTDMRFNPAKLVSGSWASGPKQVVIDKTTADKKNLKPGDHIGVQVYGPIESFEISGVAKYSANVSLGGVTFAIFDQPTAQRLFQKTGQLDAIQVQSKAGVPTTRLAAEIKALLPPTATVRNAAAQVKEDKKDLGFVTVIKYALLAFAGIAVFVGAFVIANTLGITIAQRMREFATLRTIGASRRQVLWSVLVEALIIGLTASVVGLFLGLLLAKGLNRLFVAIGINLPQGATIFATRTIVVSLLVGTLITVLASLRPARRATRVPPIAAVREGSVLLATAPRLLAIGLGVLLLFFGVSLNASRVVRPLANFLGWPAREIGGAPGILARDNASRNPARTASTASALMIGLALVTFVALFAQGLRAPFEDAVNKLFVGDYAITSSSSFAPISASAGASLEGKPGVTVASPIRAGSARFLGSVHDISAVDRNLPQVIHLDWRLGNNSVPGRLGTTGFFTDTDYAKKHHLHAGTPVVVQFPSGQKANVRLLGTYKKPKGGSPFGDMILSTTLFDRHYPRPQDQMVLINTPGGVNDASTQTLKNDVRGFADAKVQTRDQFKKNFEKPINQLLNLLYVLLALSVVVSLLGIVNTLVLTVYERTREIGMLRAVGMTRRQVRMMIRYESIVTALMGAALGIGVGIFLALLITHALSSQGIVFAVPYLQLVYFVAAAIVVGLLAAILPARRAARLNVLEALQYE